MNDLPKELLAHIQELRGRVAGDPLRSWEPHKKQRAFIDSVMSGECRVNLALWGNRTGKTDAGAWVDAAVARFGNPNAKPDGYGRIQVTDRAASIWVVSPDFPSSRDIIQPKIFDNGNVPPGQTHPPFIPQREIKEWRIADQLLKLHNGSIIGFKCLRGDQKVLMANGNYLPISQVREGDRVCVKSHFGCAGTEERYAAVRTVWRGGVKKLLRLRMRGGRALVCTPEHHVFDGLRWRQAQEFNPGDTLPYFGVPGPENPQPVGCSPFLLGLLIGDGCFRAKSILLAACDTLIAERARREAFGLGLKLRQRSASRAGDYEVTTTRGGRNFLKTFLELQGLWGKGSRDKFVPPAVMKSPDEDIREFLSGLYAADGTITKQGKIVYASSSKQLAEGIQHLLDRLAIKSALYYVQSTDSWRVVTQGRHSAARFLDLVKWVKYPEKAAALRAQLPAITKCSPHRIVAVEDAGEAEVFDLEVPGPNCYTAQSFVVHNSCDSERSKFQGTGKDLIHFDEEPKLGHYEEATIRVEAGRPLSIMFTCTILPPDGTAGGISWMFDKFVKPWRRKDNRAQDGSDAFRIFQAAIYDNPHIGREEIAQLEAMYPLGSLQRRIRLDGELLEGISGARAYGNFDYDVHVREQPEPSTHRPLVWCWDFNVSPMITVLGQRDGKVFRFMDELVIEDDASIDAMVDDFYEYYGDWKGQVWIYGDQTGEGRSAQTAETNYRLMLNRLKYHGLYPKLKLPQKNPFVRDRINAMNLQLRNAAGEHSIEIAPRCKELIADMGEVLLDPRGLIKKSHNRDDPYYRRTHASDAAGYWIAYEEPVRELSMRERVHRTVRDPGYALGRR